MIIERSPTSRRLAFPRHEDPRFWSLSPEVLRHAAGLGPATSPNAVVNGRYSLLVAARDDPEKAWNHVHQSADALKEAEDLAAMAVTRGGDGNAPTRETNAVPLTGSVGGGSGGGEPDGTEQASAPVPSAESALCDACRVARVALRYGTFADVARWIGATRLISVDRLGDHVRCAGFAAPIHPTVTCAKQGLAVL